MGDAPHGHLGASKIDEPPREVLGESLREVHYGTESELIVDVAKGFPAK